MWKYEKVSRPKTVKSSHKEIEVFFVNLERLRNISAKARVLNGLAERYVEVQTRKRRSIITVTTFARACNFKCQYKVDLITTNNENIYIAINSQAKNVRVDFPGHFLFGCRFLLEVFFGFFSSSAGHFGFTLLGLRN